MLTDASSAAMTISVMIAAVLYGATYLSFLRLLRYPRNWCIPSLSSTFTTLGLMVATVSFVSTSSGNFDPAALAASSGFIAVLFTIIAAPAIAFRPAFKWIEFLAKHGRYAGLWSFVPALAAAYAVPNITLYGVLAAAIAIELAYFIRHRPANHRHLHPIDGHDLSILKDQADGDLSGFARQHGIEELEISGVGGVSWRGCSKRTLPCPFNLYTNHLGLNTAPCCREHMMDLCHYVADCLKDMGVVHWIEGGTLLGAVRESGKLLAWEDDVDLSVVLDDGRSFGALAAEIKARGARDGYCVDVFKDKEFIAISYDHPGPWPLSWERNRMRGEIRLDLAVYRHAVSRGNPILERRIPKAAMAATESGAYGIPSEIVLPTSSINFLGEDIACPNQSAEYLRLLYGDFAETAYTYVDGAAAETRSQSDIEEKIAILAAE